MNEARMKSVHREGKQVEHQVAVASQNQHLRGRAGREPEQKVKVIMHKADSAFRG